MKTLIYFNAPDKPESMGICQLTDDLTLFLEERSTILVNPTIEGDILSFTSAEGIPGYAVMAITPDDFQN